MPSLPGKGETNKWISYNITIVNDSCAYPDWILLCTKGPQTFPLFSYFRHLLVILFATESPGIGEENGKRMVALIIGRMVLVFPETQQLRPLYRYLIQSEYAQELVNGLTAESLKELEKSAVEMSNYILGLGYFAEDLIGKTEQIKIKSRVRKRVSTWFRSVGRWPLF
jgi:hypothetical protein